MDFSLSDEQQAMAELARTILADRASHERQLEVERRGGPRFDPDLLAELAKAGLLGVAIPEAHEGAGLGFLELAAILEQVGRHTAPVPYLETTVLGALPLAAFGSDAQQAAWLPRVARGEAILTGAWAEEVEVSLEADGDGVRLSGEAPFVAAGPLADAVLVPARGAEEAGVFLVPGDAPGLSREELLTTSGQPEALLRLDGVALGADARLPADADAVVDWARRHATAALCMLSLGVCETALELTAEYAKTRKQFGQPIAMFQAVGHRAADAWIDTEGVRLTAWQAAWRLHEGLEADRQVAVAKYWAADGACRVVHAAQHLHGGVGVDREYPLHRTFLWARHLELALGGATRQLATLGDLLADG